MFDENCFFSRGGSGGAPERRVRPRPPVGRGNAGARDPGPRWAGGAPSVRQRGARAASPWIPFLEPTYPEMQRKHIPRVNECQS